MSQNDVRRRCSRGLTALCAAAGLSIATALPAAAAPASGLDMRQETAGRAQGVARTAAGSVEFDSRAVSPRTTSGAGPQAAPAERLYDRVVDTTVRVNGDTVNVRLDPVARTVSYRSSPQAVASPDDKRALVEAGDQLAGRLDFPRRFLINEQALLIRQIAFLAEAPTDQPFPTGVAPLDDQRTGPQAPSHCGGSAPGAREDAPGITYLGCDTRRHTTSHDGERHDTRTFTVRAGPDSGTDTGRCGSAGSSLQLGWTQDCLDHDYCVEHDNASPTNPFDSSCGDEYFAAVNDFTNTLPCACGPGLFDFDCDNAPTATRRPDAPVPG